MYKNKKIFILGMAKSGYEVAKLLSSDNEIFITDMKEQEKDKVEELEKLGVTIKICDDPIEYLDDSFDIMVKNPGIKYTHPCVVKAKELGIPVINEVEVAYHYIDKNVKIIGVTGSNGKTTTTSIIYEIMKKAFGDKVILAGNIGTPLCHYAKDIKKDSYLVMEISDHQLCDMYDFKTNVSVMTNIYECHTDFHDSYVMTKKKIFNNHSKDDIAIINMDNSEEMELTSDIVSTKEYFSCDKKTDCYYKDGFIYYKDEKYIDGFRGIYMPYWAYHVSQKGPVVLRGEKSKRRGDYIYTDHFDINGDMDCQYKGISFDASSSFDDNISEAIAPYDVKNMAGFTPAFLSGFYADTADVGCDVYMNDAIDMAGEETYDYVANNIPLGGVSLRETESTIKSKCNAVIESVDRTLYPVWFLSYRNRDRVAYATVNGQTGKVSADLPVSIGRYFAGSALLAVPIFILLNMFFTLRPKVTLNVAAVIALVTIILYVFELGKIKRRDQKLDDRGSWEESKLSSRRYKAGTDNDNLAKQMADGRNNARINRVSKKEKNKMAPLLKVVVIFAICMVGIPNFMFAFSLFSAVFSVGSSFFVSAACFAIGVIITLSNCRTYKEVSGGKNVPGSVGALVALAVSTLILLINPVSDLFYYGAVIFVLASLMFTLVELIKYYNVLATRRLPQFDNYKGGNDNA